jgi:hypothetical protein
MLLEKANVKRSGAISRGMDGLNNAVIPGHATPEQCTKESTMGEGSFLTTTDQPVMRKNAWKRGRSVVCMVLKIIRPTKEALS